MNLVEQEEKTDLIERAVFMNEEWYPIDQIVYEILALNADDLNEFLDVWVTNEDHLLEFALIMKEKGVNISIIIDNILSSVNMAETVN